MVDVKARIEAWVEHDFNDPSLLVEALTHPSATRRGKNAPRNNQRLEFLGDRVLGLIVAHLLIARFPNEEEGPLSRRHAALVRRETLAEIAGAFGLGDMLTFAKSEEAGNGRVNPSILADALEALIGALYLDGGLEAAEPFVRARWESPCRRHGQAAARCQDGSAGMGAGEGAQPPDLQIDRNQRTGPCAALQSRGHPFGLSTDHRERQLEASGRTDRGQGVTGRRGA